MAHINLNRTIAVTTSGGKVLPQVTVGYGPYDTIANAHTAHIGIFDVESAIPVGLKFGLIVDGTITEYIYKTGSTINDIVEIGGEAAKVDDETIELNDDQEITLKEEGITTEHIQKCILNVTVNISGDTPTISAPSYTSDYWDKLINSEIRGLHVENADKSIDKVISCDHWDWKDDASNGYFLMYFKMEEGYQITADTKNKSFSIAKISMGADIEVDDATIENNSGVISVKDGGISTDKIDEDFTEILEAAYMGFVQYEFVHNADGTLHLKTQRGNEDAPTIGAALPTATSTKDGWMSKEDKVKVDNILDHIVLQGDYICFKD